jgi:hypothetical protein
MFQIDAAHVGPAMAAKRAWSSLRRLLTIGHRGRGVGRCIDWRLVAMLRHDGMAAGIAKKKHAFAEKAAVASMHCINDHHAER